ncbi:hypothetical protein CC80DRAFT_487907 [Byssothecium circinans]|uniref:Uncharacterized protein n=1 Tax=Byssothecium circinans TaxID=147558 RepID=A0A6A5UC22_9PLEO|nr:hypothetical protein CC80DRAFT_487907 [Byssothecium circinans]
MLPLSSYSREFKGTVINTCHELSKLASRTPQYEEESRFFRLLEELASKEVPHDGEKMFTGLKSVLFGSTELEKDGNKVETYINSHEKHKDWLAFGEAIDTILDHWIRNPLQNDLKSLVPIMEHICKADTPDSHAVAVAQAQNLIGEANKKLQEFGASDCSWILNVEANTISE